MTELEVSTVIEAPPERIYGFFSDIAHFSEAFPGILSIKKNYVGSAKVGSTADMSGEIAGHRMKARIEYAELVPSSRVVLKQVSGDFKRFRQTVVIEKQENGARVTETWEYQPPYSILGQILDRVKIRKDVENYLVEGHRRAKERLEGEGALT